MIQNIVNNWLPQNMPAVAKVVVNFISKAKGYGIDLSYENNLWFHKTKWFNYYDFTPNYSVGNDKLKWMMDEVYFKFYTPKKGDVCLDIGAGVGAESIYLSSQIGDSGSVHSIEAAQSTYQLLEQNITINNCKNVKCHQLAISNKKETLYIENGIDRHIENRLISNSGAETIPVEGVTMDGFMKDNKLNTVDYLKVNIEGAEQLLIGAFKNVAQVKNIAISCHDFLGKRQNNDWLFTKDKIYDFLIKNNFEVHSQNTGIDYVDDWLYGINKNQS